MRDPAFDVIFDSQRIFRSLLDAMANPGRIITLPEIGIKSPAANRYPLLLLMTLQDHEASFCVMGGAQTQVIEYLKTNTGSNESRLEDSDFILVYGGSSHGLVRRARVGTLEYPDESATVIYDLYSIGDDEEGVLLELSGPGIADKRMIGASGIEEDEFLTHHFAHIRCEISGDLKDVLEAIVSPLVKLVSLMDHTPGQGRFTDHTRYREYHKRVYGLNDDEIDRIIKKKAGYAGELVQKMREVAEIAHARGISIASHDDDSPEKVELVHRIGACISEFPITLDAAKRGHELGMTIAMGAPNVVLGRSTSGNLSSSEAIDAGLVDLLCSDYNPGSMLYSAFILWKRGVLTLPHAVNMITRNPAEAVGMDGTIGSIEIGKRADLLVVSERLELPVVACTIVGGEVVCAAGGVR